jgi:type II secretory pathway component PulF
MAMQESLQQSFASDPVQTLFALALVFCLYVVAGILPICGALYGLYFLLTLPLRRNERARLFIHLLELGLKEGRTPEAAMKSAANSGDPCLGTRFQSLAAGLGQGSRLSEALAQVPRLLPPQIRAMLKTGERLGDLAKVLPACRQYLKDGASHVRGALNYLLVLAFAITPAIALVPCVIRIKVMPAFRQVFQTMMEGQPLPAFTRLVFAENNLLIAFQVGLVCLLWLILLAYVAGPSLRRFSPGVADWLSCAMPWRRKRLERDFSALLAVLLDAEVPEPEAVKLAAESTANRVFEHRAARVGALLKQGVKLPEAIAALDTAGELSWRLRNALQTGGGFLRALTGWHQALDAKAFQLEQSAAQVTTTLLVLFNGAAVAAFVIAVFLALISLLNNAILW